MKHNIFRVVIIALLAGVTLAAFGDDFTVNLESRILENFDNTEDSQYVWRKEASRYTVGKDETDRDNPSFTDYGFDKHWSTPPQYGYDFFPKIDHKEGWPMALFRNNRDGKDLKILGIWGKFKRMGYNWIDIYPTLKTDGEEAGPYEIPIPGRVRYLDMWVWGSNLNYYVEAYVRDEQGVIHTIYLGNLRYRGWKNLRALVPTYIPQRRRIILDPKATSITSAEDRNSIYLKFVKFRIWTTPAEAVGNFYIYFDQFKVLTDTFESLYDGDELTDPDWIRENWDSAN
ncbi:MAG: flagellar filament outer layer protein FlaA [Treponema sp.]|jgi:hypothetical protein|nr:flagellar filament outer layer protein FlaA [Treponema sp.]